MGRKNSKNNQKVQRRTRQRRRKEKKKVYYEIDMREYNEKIKNEMYKITINNNGVLNNSKEEQYEKLYQEYVLSDFNPKCLLFINRIISESKTLSPKIQSTNELHKILVSIMKKLMLNEYELTLFSVILENFDLINENKYSIETILYLIGLKVKELTTDYISIILEQIKKEKDDIDIESIYNNWKDGIDDIIKLISFKSINIKFKNLKRPYNSYCRNNYIDYNNIVDKILKMSLPYNNEAKIFDDENELLLNNDNKLKNKQINEKKENKEINLIQLNLNKKINNSKNESNNTQKIPVSFKINKKENRDKKNIKSNTKLENNLNNPNINLDKLSFSLTSNNNKTIENTYQNLINTNKINPYFQNFINNSKNLKENAKNSVLMSSKNPSQYSLNNIQQNKNNNICDINCDNLQKNSFQNLEYEDDNLRNLLNKSNQNFFHSGLSFNSINNDLDFFNNDISNNKYDYLDENYKIKSKQNSKYSLDGEKNKLNNKNIFFINEKDKNNQNGNKINYLQIYNKLKESQNKDK